MKKHISGVVVGCALLGIFFTATEAFSATTATPTVFTHSFGKGASDKETGGEVSAMQKILAKDSAVYPEGLVTGYFGPATERALQRFQKKNNIVSAGSPASTGYGFVGKRTRLALSGGVVSTVAPITPQAGPQIVVQAVEQIKILRTKPVTQTSSNTISIKGERLLSNENVSVALSGMPTGMSVSLAAGCTLPCRLQNTVTVTPAVPPGVYTITVTAKQGKALISSGEYTVSVLEVNDFSVSVRRTVPIVVQKPLTGSISSSTVIHVDLVSGTPSPVTISFVELPKYVLGTKLIGKCTPPCKVTAKLTAEADLLSGSYPVSVSVVGAHGTTSHAFNFNLMYNPKFAFHLDAPVEYKSFKATQPVAGPVQFPIPIHLSLDGGSPETAQLTLPTKLPDGIGATLSNTSCTLPCDVVLTLTALPSVKVGSHTVTVTAKVNYADNVTGKPLTMSKTYASTMKVSVGAGY